MDLTHAKDLTLTPFLQRSKKQKKALAKSLYFYCA